MFLFELMLVAGLVLVAVVAMKIPVRQVQEQPLVDAEPGHYHLTLSRELASFSSSLSQLSSTLREADLLDKNWSAQRYLVTTPNLYFLLALSAREQTLFVQAIKTSIATDQPAALSAYLQNFVDGVMINLPIDTIIENHQSERLHSLMQQWAEQHQATISLLDRA